MTSTCKPIPPSQMTIEQVQVALQQPLPGLAAQLTMAPRYRQMRPTAGVEPRQAAVLLLLYHFEGALHVVLTVRTSHLAHHSGQVSLPGGGREKSDGSLAETALREAQEEIGIVQVGVTILGPLTPLYVPPSNNCIHPYVAHCPQHPQFAPDVREVSALLEVPLSTLLDPSTRREEEWVRDGQPLLVPFYALGEHRVWGATAMILAEFVEIVSAHAA
jgi:8-oxo-dGTP pyrophosphatase MutT (NUDIX family)